MGKIINLMLLNNTLYPGWV